MMYSFDLKATVFCQICVILFPRDTFEEKTLLIQKTQNMLKEMDLRHSTIDK